MKKRITAFALTLILCAIASPAQAQVIGIMPLYTNTSDIYTNIAFSGSTATCEVDIVGKTGTSKISITVSLQKRESNGSYTTIKTWPAVSADYDLLYVAKSYTVIRGEYYRTYIEAAVTRNGTTEYVTSSSGTGKCP